MINIICEGKWFVKPHERPIAPRTTTAYQLAWSWVEEDMQSPLASAANRIHVRAKSSADSSSTILTNLVTNFIFMHS